MVKVIKENYKTKQIVCENCGSLLEYTPQDEHKVETNYYRFDRYIICPVCNKKVYTFIN